MPPLPTPSLPDWFLFAHLNLRKSHFHAGMGRIPDTISVSDTAQTPLWWDAVTLQAQHRHEHFMASSASSELLLLFVSTAVQLMRRYTAFRPSPLLLRARWQQRQHTLPQRLVWSQPQGKRWHTFHVSHSHGCGAFQICSAIHPQIWGLPFQG